MAVTHIKKLEPLVNDFIEEAPVITNTLHEQAMEIVHTMATRLQTTLNVDQLIATLHSSINDIFGCDSVTYRFDEDDIDITIGSAKRHASTYRLIVKKQPLGQLIISREKLFSSNENTILENFICNLIYPLRNALMYQRALKSALKDPMTGTSNRTALENNLSHEIEIARRNSTPLSMIMLDIDHFKLINDTHGHAIGDSVIKAVADSASETIRGADVLFRYGGEEFTILLHNTMVDGAYLLAERVRQAVEKMECICENSVIRVTVSLGVASLGRDESRETFFNKCDQALYKAKQAGRNSVYLDTKECKKYLTQESG